MKKHSCSRKQALGLAVLLAFGAPASAQTTTPAGLAGPTGAELVNALDGVFGAQGQHRANHAKGVVFVGSFTPDPQAAAVTKAVHFQTTAMRTVVRFSNFGGIADVGDADPASAPYGMSLKFYLPDGRETDIVAHSYNGFPVSTATEFIAFLRALAASGPGAVSPTPIERFAAAHAGARTFLAASKPAPVGFATQPYFGVNAFRFTNAAGKQRVGRYVITPLDGVHYLDAAGVRAAKPGYLAAQLRERAGHGPIRMRLELQLAEPGDALDDPAIAWPATRTVVTLGVLSITAPIDEQAAGSPLAFLPDELTDGIDVQDPMVLARTRAYAESLERRQR